MRALIMVPRYSQNSIVLTIIISSHYVVLVLIVCKTEILQEAETLYSLLVSS